MKIKHEIFRVRYINLHVFQFKVWQQNLDYAKVYKRNILPAKYPNLSLIPRPSHFRSAGYQHAEGRCKVKVHAGDAIHIQCCGNGRVWVRD